MRTEQRFEVSLGEAERPFALALDVGSSSVRAIVYDRLGRPLRGCAAQRPYRMSTSQAGAVQVDVQTLLDLAAATLDDVCARAERALQHLVAIGTCTFSHSLIGLDAAGEPRTAVLSWADTTSAGAAAELRNELDEAAVWQRTGAPLHASYWPARIRRLSRDDRLISCWSGFAEVLGEWLTGRHAASISTASATGMLERRHDRWDGELLRTLHLDEAALPALLADHAPLGTLRPELVARWPGLAGLPWFAGWSDGACGNVGLNCRGADRAALMIGTSSAIRVLIDDVDVETRAGLFCFRLGVRGSLLGGQLSEGGGTAAWLARLTGRPLVQLERAAADEPPLGHGLTLLPYLTGERGPGYHDRARAVIAGLSLDSGPAELFRALLEGVALRLASIDRRLSATLDQPPQIVAAGGAVARSSLWPQILADAVGRSIVVSRAAAQPSSRGAALLALAYHGAAVTEEALPLDDRVVASDAGRHERYRAALAEQEALYEMFRPQWR